MNRAAQALGRLAKGVPKNFSADELERRRKRMAAINDRKRRAKKRRMPNCGYCDLMPCETPGGGGAAPVQSCCHARGCQAGAD